MAWGLGLVNTLHGHHRHFQQASTKEISPSRALHRLAHVFSERKIAPAHSKLEKIGTFTHAGAKNISQNPTAPHAGAVFLSLLPLPTPHAGQDSPCSAPPAPKRDRIRPARSKHPKIGLFRLLSELFRGSDQNPLLLGELFRADAATAASQHLPTTLPETDDTNAGWSLPRDETAGTSASS